MTFSVRQPEQTGADLILENLGKAIGGGFEAGVSSGLQKQLKQFQERKASRQKLPSLFGQYSKQFGYDKSIDEETRRKLFKNAEALIEEGYDPLGAVNSVYDQYLADQESEFLASGKGEPKTGFNLMKGLGGAVSGLEEIGKGVKSIFSPPEERAPTKVRTNIQQQLAEAEKTGPRAYNKLLATLSRDEFLSLPKNQQLEISKQVGQIAEEEANRTVLEGILGKGGVERMALAANLPDIEFGTPQAQTAGRIFGRGLRDIGLFKAAGTPGQVKPGQIPTTLKPLEKAARTASLFGTAAAGEQLLAGETPTLGHVGTEAFIGGAAELASPILEKLFKFIKPKIFPRGSIKKPPPSPGTKIPSAPPGPPTGGAGGAGEAKEASNAIINDALENLAKKGITVDMINSGDKKALNELMKEAQKASSLFQEAEKLNVKALAKQRENVAKKLVESPLEKYFAPVEVRPISPEKAVAEEIRTKPLQTLIKQNERRARDLQYQILSADEALRAGNLNAKEIELIESTRASNALAHQKALNEIRNAEFEIKYGRAPQSTEEIQTQIDKTFAELREGIKSPTAKKVEAFKKGFERDKHLIDEANKLIERGEIPGPEVFDEYIKIHEQYLKNYDELIKELTDFIETNTGAPRMGPKVQRAKELKELIKNTKKLGAAKVALQKDKRRVMGLLKKPSGAFYKNMLKDLRKDVGEFQKDYFKWTKIAEGPEKKVAEVAKEKIKPIPEAKKLEKNAKTEFAEGKKSGEEAAKNPNSQNTKTAAERAGMSEKEYSEYLEKISKSAENLGKKTQAGTATPADENKLLKEFLDKYKKLPPLLKVTAEGVVLGTIQGAVEEATGWKPPAALVGLLGIRFKRTGILRGVGVGTVGNYVSKYIRGGFNHLAAKELKSKRNNPKEFNAYHRNLQEKYGDTRANKIRKMAIQS